MTSKLVERRTNKRGAMLILVLLIVALSVILIGSALSMTRQTRTRYYSYAEGSQSRLTVTSIAESVWEAIYVQEIDDTSLKSMADSEAVLTLTGVSVPGVNGSGSGTVKFNKPDADGHIVIECSATVGGATSNIKMTLNPPPPSTTVNLFEHVLNLGNGNSNITEIDIGAGGSGKPDNTILLQGDDINCNGSCDIYSDMFVQGKFAPQDNRFHSNLIFWGKDAQMDVSVSGINTKLGNDMGLYFVSNNGVQNSIIDGGAGVDPQGEIAEFGLYNSNFKLTTGNAFGNEGYILAAGISNSNYASSTKKKAIDYATNTENVSSDLQSQIVAKAVAFANKNLPDHFPTYAEVSGSFGCPATAPTDATTVALSILPSKPAGNYIITESSFAGDIEIDLSGGSYNLYFTTSTFNLSGHIRFVNGTKDNWGRMMLMSGSTFNMNGACGIDSFDGTKPHCYIFGNNVKFNVNEEGAAELDAYVGLYGNSELYFFTGASKVVHGRISCNKITKATGGHLSIPYCVDPTYEGGDGVVNPILTRYSVQPFVYYN